MYIQYQNVCGFYLWPSLHGRKIKQPGETEHMSNRCTTQARIDLRLSFGKWRRLRNRRVRGQSVPEKPPNSCHSTRHLAFATLLHDRMVIVGRPITLGVCHRPAVPIRQDTDRRVRRQSKWIVSHSSARIHKQCQRRLSASD